MSSDSNKKIQGIYRRYVTKQVLLGGLTILIVLLLIYMLKDDPNWFPDAIFLNRNLRW